MVYQSVRVMRMQSDSPDMIDFELWHFKSTLTNHTYIVRIERYAQHICAVKFYLKVHSDSKNKYSLLTGLKEPRNVILTILDITIKYSSIDPYSCFTFFAAQDFSNKTERNKRYEFYLTMIGAHPLLDRYEMAVDPRGAIMLVPPERIEDGSITEGVIADFFDKYYDYFE